MSYKPFVAEGVGRSIKETQYLLAVLQVSLQPVYYTFE